MKIEDKIISIDRHLKNKISGTMYIDANQFLWRVHYLLRNSEFTDRNWYSKIYVDILMAVESDLKSIIVCLSKSDELPETAYKKARKKSHHIKKLYEEVEQRSKHRLVLLSKSKKKILLDKFCKIAVSNRYDLVTFFDIIKDTENNIFDDNSVKKLLTQESLVAFEKLANEIHQINQKVKEKHPTSCLYGKRIEKYFKRITEFESKVRL